MREVPKGWTTASLGEVVEILDHARVPVNSAERQRRILGKEVGALYPYYGATGRTGDIDDYIFDETLVLLGEDGAPFLEKGRPKAYLIYGKSWVNNHAHVLRPRPDFVDPEYLVAYLNCLDYLPYVTGSTRLKLTQAAMKTIPVPLAPRDEQTRIAEHLRNLTFKIGECTARFQRCSALLARTRERVLQAAIDGTLTQGSGSQPSGWRLSTLGELGLVSGGITKNASRRDADLRRPYLRVANVYADRLDLDDVSTIGLTERDFERTRLQAGDLLIVEGNGSLDQIGRAAMWDGSIPDCTHQNHLIRWRSSGDVLPEFVLFWLLSPEGRAALVDEASSTTGLYTLSLSKVSRLSLRVPPVLIQQRCVDLSKRILGGVAAASERLALARRGIEQVPYLAHVAAFEGRLQASSARGAISRPARPEGTQRTHKPAEVRTVRPTNTRKQSGDASTTDSRSAEALAQVLQAAGAWVPAQLLFEQCGATEGAPTELFEQLYAELRKLEREKRVEVEPLRDSTGRKVGDRIRWRAGEADAS